MLCEVEEKPPGRREEGRKDWREGGREGETQEGKEIGGERGRREGGGVNVKGVTQERCPTAATNDIMFQDSLEHAGANRDFMSVAGQPVPKLDSAFHLSPFCVFFRSDRRSGGAGD